MTSTTLKYMAVFYRNVDALVVAPGDTQIWSLETVLSPTTIVYGVRSFFDGDGGRSRNFDFVPTYYGVGYIAAAWDGYISYKKHIEYATQYHFTGFSSDLNVEPAYIYPDRADVNDEREDYGGKVPDENGESTFEWAIPNEACFPIISAIQSDTSDPLGEYTAKPCRRLVLKSKQRLYENAIIADTLYIECYSTAKQPLVVDIIQIR